MIDKGIKKTELANMADISQTTLAKLSKNQYVSMDVLVKYVTVWIVHLMRLLNL